MTDDPWKDADTLERLYHGEDLNQSEIADRLDTSAPTISYWMDKLSVDTTHTSHDPDPDVLGPETCQRPGCDNRTALGSASAGESCDECIDRARGLL